MNRSTSIALLVTTALLLVIFLLYLGKSSAQKFKWNESYNIKSKQPYGTYVIHGLLGDYFPEKEMQLISKSLVTELPENPIETSNYIFIGQATFLDSADVQRLLDFVANGNNVFISSKSLPYDLMFHVYFDECPNTPWNDHYAISDTLVNFNLYHHDLEDRKGYHFPFKYRHRIIPYKWNYIDSVYFCDMEEGFVELGAFNTTDGGHYVNFVQKPYYAPDDYTKPGGKFYFHTSPIAFSNLNMLEKTGKEYAEKIFSHLDNGPIYWDNYSQVPEPFSRSVNQSRQNPGLSLSSETPLKFILANKHLSWAWYSSLLIGLLYLAFSAKRKQRIIPIVDKNSNTSLEFVSTIASLYYHKKNHKNLCQLQMKMFLAFLRNRYHINTKNLDAHFVEQIARQSGIIQDKFNEIITYNNKINNTSFVSDETLLKFHRAIVEVRKRCK